MAGERSPRGEGVSACPAGRGRLLFGGFCVCSEALLSRGGLDVWPMRWAGEAGRA